MKGKVIESLKQHYIDRVAELNKKHIDHLVRVEKAIDWYNENKTVVKDENHFTGNRVMFEEAECMITSHRFNGIPFFFAEYTIRPMEAKNDIGRGCGNEKEIKF